MARLQCDTPPLFLFNQGGLWALLCWSYGVFQNLQLWSASQWTSSLLLLMNKMTDHGRTDGRTGTSPIHVTRAYHAHALLGPAGSPAAAILACNPTLHLLHHCSLYIACNRVISFSPWRIGITEALLTPTVPLCTESWIHRVRGEKKNSEQTSNRVREF
jgi:hypothetical protein